MPRKGRSLGKLMLPSAFDWRSIGLPAVIAGVALSAMRVPCPATLDLAPVMPAVFWMFG